MASANGLFPPGVILRRATPEDATTFVAIHEDAARWLWERGIRQWRPGTFPTAWLDGLIARGEVSLALLDDQPVGTVILLWADEETWGPRPDDAGYIHGLRVLRAAAGRGIGRALLAWAECEIARAGRPYARLDCIADNPRLCQYYLGAGYTRVEDITEADGSRLARFQRRVRDARRDTEATAEETTP